MDSNVSIRPATVRDLKLIENLLQENCSPYQDVPEKLADLFIGSIGSKVVGIGGLEVHENFGLLRSLVIKAAFRGQGYGKALATKLIELAKAKELKEVYLLTTTAVTFFSNMGFEKVGRSLVPSVIQNTSQFTSLCPAEAVCLLKVI
jgi:amino-acid N-acetyltransferase